MAKKGPCVVGEGLWVVLGAMGGKGGAMGGMGGAVGGRGVAVGGGWGGGRGW